MASMPERNRFDMGLSVILLAVLAAHFARILGVWDAPLLVGTALMATVPVIWGAYKSFREGEWASMDLLASIALLFSLVAAEFSSAIFIGLMLASSRILTEMNASRAEANIRSLLKLRPANAKVERGGSVLTVRAEEVQLGEIVVVGIGDRIPVDGTVLSGDAAVDESSLTGESLPVDKSAGGKVVSASVITSGTLRIKTERVGKDTAFERIITLVSTSREEKPRSETLGELFGKVYLIGIILGSGALYFFTRDLNLVLSVVLVVCADDVAIAIPLAYVRGIGLAAKRGVIVKGGKHLEALGKIRTVIFDKTGTLTKGALAVAAVLPVQGITEERLLSRAALAARTSSHPLSRAILARAGGNAPEPKNWEEFGGKGVSASDGTSTVLLGKRAFIEERGVSVSADLDRMEGEEADKGRSVSFVSENGTVIGIISAADKVKGRAKEAIADLKARGIARIVMLTGDNDRAAHAIAAEIGGIDEIYARLLPEDKVAVIKKLQADGPVIMVGDGVNDAAALSIANVGIAMGALGAESTIESAQIILMRDDLSQLPRIFDLSKTVRRVAVEDFYIWGITNAIGLALVFMGVIGPAGAAAYNFISDFFPLLNSFRVAIPRPRA